MADIAHLAKRGAVTGLIQECRSCELVDDASAPVPFSGPSPNRLMILGDAPGRSEDRRGKPFVGPAGKYLNRALYEHSLPDLAHWFCANVVCCRCVGVPSLDDRFACSGNLRAQLHLCNPEWVLTLGATALQAVIPRSKITEVRGRPFLCPAGAFIGRWILPTFHPSAVLRDEKLGSDFGSDLSTLSQLLSGRMEKETLATRVGRGGRLFT